MEAAGVGALVLLLGGFGGLLVGCGGRLRLGDFPFEPVFLLLHLCGWNEDRSLGDLLLGVLVGLRPGTRSNRSPRPGPPTPLSQLKGVVVAVVGDDVQVGGALGRCRFGFTLTKRLAT